MGIDFIATQTVLPPFIFVSFESTFFFFLSLSLSHWHFLDLVEIYRIFCFSFFPPNNKNIKKKKVSFDSIFNFQKREREEKLIISRWEANFSPPPTISRDRFQLKFLLVRSLSINFGKRRRNVQVFVSSSSQHALTKLISREAESVEIKKLKNFYF